MIASLSTVFGFLATVLAIIGLYGVMSYTVAQRTREIGIRMALGAAQGNVVWMVMREVLRLIAIGIAAGIPAAHWRSLEWCRVNFSALRRTTRRRCWRQRAYWCSLLAPRSISRPCAPAAWTRWTLCAMNDREAAAAQRSRVPRTEKGWAGQHKTGEREMPLTGFS
jgi:hypothetical protein